MYFSNDVCKIVISQSTLTLVSDAEARRRATVVSGEQQEQEVGRRDQEMRRLGSVVLADQGGGG